MEEAARRLGVQLIKQYGAQEHQAELKVRVQISGSWFGGQLTAEERRELYWAQAKGWSEAHKFPKQGRAARADVQGHPVHLRVGRD